MRLERLVRLSFTAADAGPAELREPCETDYFADLAARYGREFRPEVLDHDALVGYSDMAERLLAELGPIDGALDVVIVGHAVPDPDIGRFVGCSLSAAAPGEAMPIAVTDQGNATPFTALRLAQVYADGPDVHRVLVVLLDQTSLPYDEAPTAVRPLHDCGVALLFSAGAGDVVVRQRPGVHASDISTTLAEMMDELMGNQVALSVVAGPTLAEALAGAVLSEPGRPATGLWWSAVEAPAGRLLLADHDPDLGYLSVAVLDR